MDDANETDVFKARSTNIILRIFLPKIKVYAANEQSLSEFFDTHSNRFGFNLVDTNITEGAISN